MVISRMISPHAIHRGEAAGSGGLTMGLDSERGDVNGLYS